MMMPWPAVIGSRCVHHSEMRGPPVPMNHDRQGQEDNIEDRRVVERQVRHQPP